jgi:hypothetical protein
MRKLALLLVLLVLACGEEDTKLAQTQITLTVQADNALQGQLDTLRATLFANEGNRWSQRSSVDVPASKLRWPLDIPIVAQPEDEAAQIEVIIEAYASGQRLAQARMVARFVKDRVSTASVQISACAGRDACAADSCHGESCEVCSPSGDCIALASTTPADAGTPSQGKDAGNTLDAAREDASAQLEDATTPNDASTPVDSGPPPTSCPENACAAPYVCITTPAGYTCRGQFADWPMPDTAFGAKTKPSYTPTPDIVTDNVTKLVWQVGAPRIVPGCTEYIESNGGNGDTGELCTRPQAKAYCENLVHGGFDDWRLPSVIELSSLYDSTSKGGYSIDSAAFADTDYGPYVSDSTYAGGPGAVWGVNFWSFGNYFLAGYAGKVRCVRAGAVPTFATPADRYLVAGEQVTDRATGLVWQRTVSTTKYTEKERDAGLPLVDTACNAPWRLPTIKELLTLIDFARSSPAIDPDVFPNTPNEYFWGLPLDWGYVVSFETGGIENYEDVGLVRCVQ